MGIQRLKIDRENLELPNADDKAVEIIAFEDELHGKTRALKKLNKRKRKKILASSPASQNDDLQTKCNKVAKIKQNANTWMEEDITPDDVEAPPIKKARKLKVVEQKSLNGIIDSDEASTEVTPKSSAIKRKQPKEQQNGFADSDEAELTKKSSAKKPMQPKELNGSTLEAKLSNGTPKKIKSKPSTPQQSNVNVSQSNIVETPKNNKKSNDWDVPLDDGETEYFIPSKKSKANGVQGTTTTKATPSPKVPKIKTPKSGQSTPQTLDSRVVALKNSTPKSAFSSAEKKVKIVLKMNKSQEATEYIRQLKQSPNLPFDSSRKPLKGVLKPNLMPSPINPFYKKMIGL